MIYEIYTTAGRWAETDDLSDALESMATARTTLGMRPWIVGPSGRIDTSEIGTHANPVYEIYTMPGTAE